MLNFDFLEKDQGIVSSPHFAYDFSKKKTFFMFYSIIDQISLLDCLYFLRYWSICVLESFVNQVKASQILKLTYLSDQTAF